jgi:hypothetical protein
MFKYFWNYTVINMHGNLAKELTMQAGDILYGPYRNIRPQRAVTLTLTKLRSLIWGAAAFLRVKSYK